MTNETPLIPLDTPLFPISVAAVASRTAANTMRMWFKRGRVQLEEHDKPSSTERPARLLTFRTVLTLAAAADLTRGDRLDVSQAYNVAKRWTFENNSAQVDGENLVAPAARLFSNADRILTVLIHYGGDEVSVIPVTRDESGELRGMHKDMIFPLRYPVLARPMLLALNPVYEFAHGVCVGSLNERAE